MLERAQAIEDKQNQRALQQNCQLEAEEQKQKQMHLMTGNCSMQSVLDKEDEQRKTLVKEMNNNAKDSLRPVVKVLNNMNGI